MNIANINFELDSRVIYRYTPLGIEVARTATSTEGIAVMLDLQQIESFRMVALTHNFTRAAAELGCSQSSVTLHVKALERELGASLLERHRFSKTVQLTELGRRTLEYAERLLALASEAKEAVRKQLP